MYLRYIVLQCILSGGVISLCAAVKRRPRENATVTMPHVNNVRPKIKNLRCIDRDLQRTLKWTVHNVTKDLQLKRYILHFDALTNSARHYKLRCYEDEARTKRFETVDQTECKTNTSQFLFFTSNEFRVQGVFVDALANTTIKSNHATVKCYPVDYKSTLSAPKIHVLVTSRTSLHVAMNLPNLLQKTIDYMRSPPDLKYYFCVSQRGKHCNLDANSTQKRFGLTPTQIFEGLESGTSYDVRGWYILSNPDKDIKSEETQISAETRPDPFPSWAQILTVSLACGVIILAIFCTFVGRMGYKIWLRVETETKKGYPSFLVEALAEAQSYANFPQDPTAKDLLSNWMLLQRKQNEVFDIPLIQTKSRCKETKDKEIIGATSRYYGNRPSQIGRGISTSCTREQLQDDLLVCESEPQLLISASPYESKYFHSQPERRSENNGNDSNPFLRNMPNKIADYVKVVTEDTCLIPGEYAARENL